MRSVSGGSFHIRLIALMAGVLGVLLAVLVPLLPVQQDRASIDWRPAQAIQLTAPLVDYVPLTLDLRVPCAALRELPGGTVLSTVPTQAPGGAAKGLIARIEELPGSGRTLSVTLRDKPLITASVFQMTGVGTASETAVTTPSGVTPQAVPPAPGSTPAAVPPTTASVPPAGAKLPQGGTTPTGPAPSDGPTPPAGATPPAGSPPTGPTPPAGQTPPGGPTPPAGLTPPTGPTPPAGTTPPAGSAPAADAPLPPAGSGSGTEPGPGSGAGSTPNIVPHKGCDALVVHSTASGTTAELTGLGTPEGKPFRSTVTEDIRPQIVGVYTDLDQARLGDATLHAEVDARFSSRPSAWKLAAMAGAGLCTLVALVCLYFLDAADGRRRRRFLPARWWRFTGTDASVLATLGVWHVIGANTSDDGYILTMARVSKHAGYTANYYRWYGVAEAPFGWPYELLAQMTRISDASVWLRLPALLAGVLCWWVISREVLPRLGSRVRSAGPRWTAALVFLALWLPYNNGLRPEPFIALGALLTWCSIERAIATRRLLPAAVAVLIAAFSLAAGPSGLICLAALFAGSRRVLFVPAAQVRATSGGLLGYLARIAPVLTAGTLVLTVVFADQTLASVAEATRVRKLVGPDFSWPDEPTRWISLLSLTPDGSLSRRFGVLAMLLCLAVCLAVALRKGGRIPDTARGPVARVLGIAVMSPLLMAFTPTKWTHHFGVYAGLAGALAAVTAVAVGGNGIRLPYLRTLFAAAVLFLVAFSFTGSNGWWYVSGYGVRWPDRAPLAGGVGIASLIFGLGALCLAVAAWQYYREPYRSGGNIRAAAPFDRIVIRPLTIAAAVLVAFEVATMASAAWSQYPAYSVALSNIRALEGKPCAMADDVLVETATADSVLQPYTGAPADGLAADNTGFTANGVGDLAPEGGPGGGTGSGGKPSAPPPGGGPTDKPKSDPGINGSSVALPYGLDPKRTPVLGDYTADPPRPSHLTTQWYRLDLVAAQQDSAFKALILTVAGHIAGEQQGHRVDGAALRVEFAHRADDGTLQPRGELTPPTVGGAPGWRNLPIPLDRIPSGANAVRLIATADDPTGKQWLAVTPPRLPRLATLDAVVGHDAPVLTDFHVGLAFPCQHPFDHRDGVAQLPAWRILPDKLNAQVATTWQGDSGGGPLGWSDLLVRSEPVPAYLDHDWTRDWGELQRLTPYVDAPAAPVTVRVENRWGWADDDPIRAGPARTP
ncbi:arabinosyltransferase domain-containing protein [Nocardia sp. NPDC004340]